MEPLFLHTVMPRFRVSVDCIVVGKLLSSNRQRYAQFVGQELRASTNQNLVHDIPATGEKARNCRDDNGTILHALPTLRRADQGFGVFPCLTFTHSPVELPVVPLSVTSRVTFMVENNGFSDMEVSYRLPQHCPVDIVVSFPEGRQVSLCFTFMRFLPKVDVVCFDFRRANHVSDGRVTSSL